MRRCLHRCSVTYLLLCPPPTAQVSALLQQGRMVLALDLDHTLLNSARTTELDSETTAQLVGGRRGAQLWHAGWGMA